ncbi:10498_t:CDS:2, partial [Cetraspora pellucida]
QVERIEAFENTAQLAAKNQGFAFSRKDSNLTGRNGKSPFVVLQCTKEETRKRKKKTRREDCSVYIRATATKCQSTADVLNTEIKWIVTKVVLEHNHTKLKLDEVVTFPQHHAMNLRQKILVQQLHDSNAPTCVITTAINKISNGGMILSKDIVNKHARIRLALNEGYNNDSTQTLLKLLEERNYVVVPHKTVKGYLTHLFFFHIEAAKCVAKCPEVLIVDSTYRTNIYKYSLVSVVGINNISNEKGVLATYQIAMAWIEDESEASYTWFLQTLRTKIYDIYGCLPEVFMSDRDQALRNASSKVFPTLDKMLCVWHLLEQNLKVNCQKLFKNDDDYEVFKKEVEALQFTEIEEEIPQSFDAVKKTARKANSPEKIVSYIQTWMKDSRIAFKQSIKTAGNLESVFHQIDQAMRSQHLKAAISTDSDKVVIDPFTLHNPRFSELIGNVSTWAIEHIKRTLQKKQISYKNTDDCECLTKINYKLSCQHIIPMNGPIPLSIINKRWLLERPDIIEILLPSKSIDSEFYNSFINAEERFQQLPDNIAKAEFITRICQATNIPLFEPIKLPQKAVPKSSTKRGSLQSERQDSAAKKKKRMLDNITKLKNKTIQQHDISIKQTFIMSQPSDYKLYQANLPKFMHAHVLAYNDVTGDGNCDFRTVAISIGKPEDYWPELFLEKEKEYNEILFITQWNAGPYNKDYWMSMPSFGYAIANTFQ